MPVELFTLIRVAALGFAFGVVLSFAGRMARRRWPDRLCCLTGTVAALPWLLAPPAGLSVAAFTALVLTALILAAIDTSLLVVPDALILALFLAGLAYRLGQPGFSIAEALLGAALGGLVIALPAFVYLRCRGISGLGAGDIAIMTVAGAVAGPESVPLILVVASVTTLAVALAFRTIRRRSMRRRWPFAPGLLAALIMALVLQV